MRKPKRVLFVGHDASRTGAPLLLLHFLRWLSANSRIEFEILLSHGGELVRDYSSIARTHVLNPRSHDRQQIWRRVRKKLRLQPPLSRLLGRRYPVDSFPVVYSNTVANGEIVAAFGRRGHRIICHAHEMRFGIERWGGRSGKDSSALIQSFVAASAAVKWAVAETWGIEDGKIEVIHEFGQPFEIDPAARAGIRRRIRRELGLAEADIVVGMCGTLDWRKGADLFPPLAKAVLDRANNAGFRFLWIGSPPSALEQLQLDHDCELLGVKGRVTIAGQVPNPHEFMCAFDIFALTSREDPCPLAMLEAATLGLPIVCFAQSGGAPEFVGQDAGMVAPYLDIGAMAGAVLKLGADPAARESLGRAGMMRALAGFTLQSQAPKLLAVIEHHLL